MRGAVSRAILVLGALHAVVLLADFVAPYDYFEQDRRLPLAPPTRLRFVDAEGGFHLRPFVYRLKEERLGEYSEESGTAYPVRFLVAGATPRRLGPFELKRRLFGVDSEARILLLGSDRFGRDQFSRLLYGGRLSLFAGLVAGVLTVGLGFALGAAAGYHGGAVDVAVMRAGELFMSLPWLYLLIAVRAFLPLDVSATGAFLLTVLVICFIGWVRPARLVRGVVLSAKERDFVRAARGFGASDLYLVLRHVLPQTWGVVLTQLAILIPRFVLAEIVLSFLGLGTAEPTPSWGSMLAPLLQYHVLVSYWWMAAPAVALIGVVVSYHQLASALQERLSTAGG